MLRKLLFGILRYSGLSFLLREFIQKDKVTILLFHNIVPEGADIIFKYLKNNYSLISLERFVRSLENKEVLPDKSLVITFDDGFIENYKLIPIFDKFKIPVTIFLTAGVIDTNRRFWFKYEGLTSSRKRILKQLSNRKRIKMLQAEGFDQLHEYNNPMALTKNQINEMSEFIDFQSHTMFHPSLSKCTDKEIYDELLLSKEKLEKEYGFDINKIAYPSGDYSEKVIKIAKEVGYNCGITVDYGFNSRETDLFKLKRLSVNDASDINEFIVKSSGLWGLIRKII